MKLLRPFIAVFIFNMLFGTSVAKAWDHFVFVQRWPPAECVEAEHLHKKCHVGMEVSTWTIHGLWPSLGRTHTPAYCNNSYKFNFDKIADLKESLLKYWPDFIYSSGNLWKHEWVRHGTCCMDLSSTAGEHNYFATSLRLNRKYDLLKFLRQGNVTPNSNVEYKVSDFINAIEKATGVKPHLTCSVREEYDLFGRKTNFTLIFEVQISLKKDLTPMKCPAEYPEKNQNPTSPIESKLVTYDNLDLESCPLKLLYPPIKYV